MSLHTLRIWRWSLPRWPARSGCRSRPICWKWRRPMPAMAGSFRSRCCGGRSWFGRRIERDGAGGQAREVLPAARPVPPATSFEALPHIEHLPAHPELALAQRRDAPALEQLYIVEERLAERVRLRGVVEIDLAAILEPARMVVAAARPDPPLLQIKRLQLHQQRVALPGVCDVVGTGERVVVPIRAAAAGAALIGEEHQRLG